MHTKEQIPFLSSVPHAFIPDGTIQLPFVVHSSMHCIGESKEEFIVVTQQCGTHAFKYIQFSKTIINNYYFWC